MKSAGCFVSNFERRSISRLNKILHDGTDGCAYKDAAAIISDASCAEMYDTSIFTVSRLSYSAIRLRLCSGISGGLLQYLFQPLGRGIGVANQRCCFDIAFMGVQSGKNGINDTLFVQDPAKNDVFIGGTANKMIA